MTQVIGLVALVLLLAFSAVLFALLSAAVRKIGERDMLAARKPLVLFTILTSAAAVSLFTWAKVAFVYVTIGLDILIGSNDVALVNRLPSSVWIGLVALALVALLLSPGLRGWIADNYLPMSVAVLGIALIGGVITSLVIVTGSWSVLATFILLGVVVSLGKQGLVFVPRLDDGPRLGENTLSALKRVISLRIRQCIYRVTYALFSIPERLLTRNRVNADVAIRNAYGDRRREKRVTPERNGLARLPGGRQLQRSLPQPSRIATALTKSYWVKRGLVAVVLVTTITIGALLAFTNRTAGTFAEQQATPDVEMVSDVDSLASPVAKPKLATFKIKNTDGDGIFLREQPSRDSKPIGSLLEGATVEQVGTDVVEAEGISWRQIKDAKGNVGWASAQFLEPIYDGGMVRVANAGGEGVFLRAKPSKSGGPIRLVREGTEFRIAGPDVQADGITWRNVTDEKGTSGWISSEYIAPISQ